MKKIVIISLLILAARLAYAQNSIEPLFNYSKALVNELEKLKYEMVYVDMNILTESDNTEENIRMFAPGNDYVILAYGDPERIKKIKVRLYESRNAKWELAHEGEPLTPEGFATMQYTSSLKFNTKESNNQLIQVEATEFKDGNSSGRFVIVIGHQPTAPVAVQLRSARCQDVKLTKKNEIVNVGGSHRCESLFTVTAGSIIHEKGNKIVVYKIKTSKEVEGGFLYTVEDDRYASYAILLTTGSGTLDIFKATNDKSLGGVRYFVDAG